MDIKLVGEIGINHNGNLASVKALINAAKEAGFDFVKMQKRDPDTCVPEKQKDVMRDTPWGQMKYIDYRKLLELGLAEYDYIDEYCEKQNIGWFASAWDLPSAKFLDDIGCRMIKIPSAKLTDIDLLRFCRKQFDFVILSTGMSTEDEIKIAYALCKPDVIMHSVSMYPTSLCDAKLNYINWLKDNYPCPEVGYSGHEQGINLVIAAAACGATWIERHITLDKDDFGSDQKISIEPAEMQQMAKDIREIEQALKEGYSPRQLLEGELLKREQLRG